MALSRVAHCCFLRGPRRPPFFLRVKRLSFDQPTSMQRHSVTGCFMPRCYHQGEKVPEMTSLRSADLQLFLTSAEAAIRHRSGVDGPVRAGCRKDVHGAPDAVHPSRAARQRSIARLPPSGDDAGTRAPSARSYRRLGRCLCRHRTAAHLEGPGWRRDAWRAVPGRPRQRDNHGPEGLEIRRDVWIGVSLMAPHTRYPDHRHPPEEIYVVLSDGQWRQASDPWHEPGIGGLVYNPPNVVHAMRSTERPLLALWFLWTEQISS